MSALDIGWNTEARAKTGFRPFGRDSLDCGANYGNGVHWSVPLTGLTLYSSDATLDLCLMYSSLSGTWSGFSIYIFCTFFVYLADNSDAVCHVVDSAHIDIQTFWRRVPS